jgi:hypothetical protein
MESPKRTHRVAMATFWRIYSFLIEKSDQPGEGGGCTTAPFHYMIYLPSHTKSWGTFQLRGWYNTPISTLSLHVLCGKAYRGRILGGNWDKSLQSFPPCYSQSPLLTDLTPPPPWAKVIWNWFVIVNIEYRNLKSGNSQDYARKPQQNCMSMNSASGVRIVCGAIMNSDTGLLLVCSTHTPPVCTIGTLFTFYTGLIGHAMHPL